MSDADPNSYTPSDQDPQPTNINLATSQPSPEAEPAQEAEPSEGGVAIPED